ncbi:MAG: MgtC/SapB family protein [Eubacteriales bacterium]
MFAFWDIMLRLAIALAAGASIGTQREYKKGTSAGLRTHSLVSLGACLAMLTNEFLYIKFGGSSTDIARMAAYVISGIGFLGAGSIIKDGIRVRGLTTAAGLWVVACLGITAGAGFYSATAIGTALVFIVMWSLKTLEYKLFKKKNIAVTVLEIDNTQEKLIAVLNVLAANKMKIKNIEMEELDNENSVLTIVSTTPSTSIGMTLNELKSIQYIKVISMDTES